MKVVAPDTLDNCCLACPSILQLRQNLRTQIASVYRQPRGISFSTI